MFAQRMILFQIEMWELLWQKFLAVGCFKRKIPGKHVLAGEIWLCNEDEVELYFGLSKFNKKITITQSYT